MNGPGWHQLETVSCDFVLCRCTRWRCSIACHRPVPLLCLQGSLICKVRCILGGLPVLLSRMNSKGCR